MEKVKNNAHFFVQVHKIRIIKRQVTCKQYEEYDSTRP